jgi:hypothetical protein
MIKLVKWTVMVLVAGLLVSCERNDNNGTPSVTSASNMICKGNGILKTSDPVPETSCINYSYDGNNLLTMMHLNASFNCCPKSFAVDFEVKGDSLIIREDDAEHLCKCNCLYDIEIKVHNLPADNYHVRIAESFENYSWPKLIFDLDLKKTISGQVCVTRPEGWWR